MSEKVHSRPVQRTFRGKNAQGQDHEVTISSGVGYPAWDHRDYVPQNGKVYDAIPDDEARERGIANDDHEAGLVDPPRPTEAEIRELKIAQARDDLALFQAETLLKQLNNTVKDGRVTVVSPDGDERTRDVSEGEHRYFHLQRLELEHVIDQAQRHMAVRAERIAEMEAQVR